MRSRQQVVWVIVAFALALSSTAVAQPGASDPKAEAKTHVETGTRLFDAQQYGKAAEEYQQAYLLDPQPLYLYASAQALRLDGNCTRALRSYRAYLRTNPSPLDADKAQKNIDRCEQDLKDHPPVTDPRVVTPPLTTQPQVLPPAPPPTPTEPPSRSWTRDWAGHALVGGGVIVAATGLVLYLGGRSTIEDHNSSPTYGDFVAGRGDLDAAKLKQTLGVSAIAVGGALVVGGIVRYVVHGRGDRATHVSASIAPNQATFVVTRSF